MAEDDLLHRANTRAVPGGEGVCANIDRRGERSGPRREDLDLARCIIIVRHRQLCPELIVLHRGITGKIDGVGEFLCPIAVGPTCNGR